MTLAGRTIGVTAGRRADEQQRFFERRGATVILAPTVRALAAGDEPEFRTATAAIIAAPPDVVLLHTGTGVRAWFAAATALGIDDDLRQALRRATVYARGPKSARAAIENGVEVAWQSPNGRFRDLVDRVATNHPGARVAVQLDGELDAEDEIHVVEPTAGEAPGDRYLVEALHGIASETVAIPIYRWALPTEHAPAHALVQQVAAGEVHAVTFTSSPAVVGLVKLAGELGRSADLVAGFAGGVVAASIGEVCTATLRRHGITPRVEPERPRLGALLLATAQHLGQ